MRRLHVHPALTVLLLGAGAARGAGETEIPHVAALDRSAVKLDRLDDPLNHALILGNGDLNGLVWSEGGGVVLTVTKNDVWDARLDSKLDPPLPTLARIKELAAGDWKDRTLILPEGSAWKGPDSYHAHPYPCPRACARIRIGDGKHTRWKQIRAEGSVNAWERRDNETVMRIVGGKGASNGYSFGPLDLSTDQYPKLHITLAGSENAKFYVDVMGDNDKILFASQWTDSPTQPTEQVFNLPPGQRVRRLILYTWIEEGDQAENRFASVAFAGANRKHEIDLDVSPIDAKATLDIRRAVVHIETRAQAAADPSAFDLRALSNRNAFLITSAKPLEIALELIVSGDLPESESGSDGEVEWIVRKITGDADWPGMTFAVALSQDPSRQRTAVAVVTSREFGDPRAAAVRMAYLTCRVRPTTLITDHDAKWQKFWSRSGIDLDDPLHESVWYRSLYFLRCVSKPGVISPGLFAGLINDTPAWHGDYHTNYNLQQTFWSAYAANQIALTEPYDRLITEYRPRARWLAKQVFACGGAYYPHVLFAYEPSNPAKCKSPVGRQYLHHVWGFTIGVAGFTVQPIWWRYKYDPDPAYLEETAYPAVAEVADFYADFIDQCDKREGTETVILGPSVSPEHWGWTPKFKRNRDCTFDIAMVRFIFAAAIEGAEALVQDTERIKRWRKAIGRLPAYPLHGEGNDQVVVDVADAPPITYNIPVPATPVFPGEQVTYRSPASERELFARTIRKLKHNGNNAPLMLASARLRLDMPDAYERLQTILADRVRPNGTLSFNRLKPTHRFNQFGHYTEMFGAAHPVTETLLQSVGDVVRVFPGLPAGRSASFTRLRAQGGFLVTARREGTGTTDLSIESTRGGVLRLVLPWPVTEYQPDGQKNWTKSQPDNAGLVVLETKAGQTFHFRPAPS